MRPSEPFTELESAKAKFASSITRALQKISGVKSITFPGSFVEKPGLSGLSDIDVVVVVELLTQACFTACHAAIAAAQPADLGLPEHRLIINDTFGPLKFNQPSVIVVHLMVYDLAGHRDHVLKSPFTCLDWERSRFHAGNSLRNLYPTLPLQPRQFSEARRSLTNYVADITSGTISYRRHHFAGGTRSELLEHLPLDRRHQGEYAFHIVRNLVANYAKLILKSNCRLADAALLGFWREHLPTCISFIDWFTTLHEIKQARLSDFPTDTPDRTREFLTVFALELEETWTRRAMRHVFMRHARTELNDGRFLGQRLDPPIREQCPPLRDAPQNIYASPARRCRETLGALAPDATPVVDARLHEIDYGKAEGLDASELKRAYPDMAMGWARGEDPPFPGGENTTAVVERLDSFLRELPSQPSLVVTHNVVLRCLLGNGLGLPQSTWHRIPVAHLEAFEVLRLGGVSYLNLSSEQVAKISDSLVGHLP